MAYSHKNSYKYFFDGDKHTATVANIYAAELEKLRALRLWHWQGVMYRRKAQQSMEAKGNVENAEWQERQANFHLKAVQTLNDFFPVGDTAERDAAQ